MIPLRQTRAVVLLVISFFLLKLPTLCVPYFWDELAVYSRAALYMFDHGIGILPGALPSELSRGHPLLCPALFAVGYELLGPHLWAAHLVALLWSCGLLCLTYGFAARSFGHETATLAVALLGTQPVFIAQASMVLPEVMLAVFCTGALWAYLEGRLAQLAVLSTLAILTKETAIAVPCCLAAAWLASAPRTGLGKRRLLELCSICVPLAVWGLFLLLQKSTLGWFFFPLHRDGVSLVPEVIWRRTLYYATFMFVGQGRYAWSALGLLAGACLLRVALLRAGEARPGLKSLPHGVPLMILYLVVSGVILVLNFSMARYVLMLLPVMCALVAAQAVWLLRLMSTKLWRVALVLCLFAPVLHYRGRFFHIDADMLYLDLVGAQKAMSAHMNRFVPPDAVVAAEFPFLPGLEDRRAGYSSFEYRNLIWCGDPRARSAEYVVAIVPTRPNFYLTGDLQYCAPDATKHQLVRYVTSSLATIYLYRAEPSGRRLHPDRASGSGRPPSAPGAVAHVPASMSAAWQRGSRLGTRLAREPRPVAARPTDP